MANPLGPTWPVAQLLQKVSSTSREVLTPYSCCSSEKMGAYAK